MFDLSINSQIFWFGDLNYRLNMVDEEVRKLVAQKRWDELLNSDQVRLLAADLAISVCSKNKITACIESKYGYHLDIIVIRFDPKCNIQPTLSPYEYITLWNLDQPNRLSPSIQLTAF